MSISSNKAATTTSAHGAEGSSFFLIVDSEVI